MTLAEKLSEERRARLAAERLLEQKQAELHAANRRLGRHAKQLSEEIVETRAEVQTVRDENLRFRSEITEANHKIAIAERRLWLSIQSIHDGFAFFDAEGRMIAANRAWLTVFDGLEEVAPGVSFVRMLQLATEEGIIDPGAETPAQWRARMIDRWQDATPDSEVVRLWNGEFIRLMTQRGHGGDMVSLATNITETVRYEARLKAARRRAEAASRAKSAFLANMSHEIRTPMNGVVGMAEMLCDTALTADQRLYADTIRKSGEALLVIINDVLDYSKIEADKLELHARPFDLERCIHDVVTLLMPSARDKGLDICIDYDLFLPTGFLGDEGRLRQVLTNLVGNAVKFTARGHVLIRVTGLPAETGDGLHLHVSVEDTGIGIPPDKIAHVFEDFSQVEDDRDRPFEGTGLGLAITRRLIGLMGGEVWVDSEPGAGSVFGFRVSLPVAGAAPAPPPPLPEGLRRVLVVDDEPIHRTILIRQMEMLGARGLPCASGAEALAQAGAADLVLTAHGMPGMDGFELAQALRDAGHDLPVVMLSANPGHAETDPARMHLSALLHRPTPRHALFAALAALGDDRRAEEPAPAPMPTFASRRARIASGERRLRLLAAEDNATNRTVFRKMLGDARIDLHFARDGEEALSLWRRLSPDLIFMDISMPRLDGKAATRAIRAAELADGRVPVPIIAMTAHAVEGDAIEILAAGLDAYLAKPLRRNDIWQAIDRFTPPGIAPPFAEVSNTQPDRNALPRPGLRLRLPPAAAG
ncbi:response regulator [Pseudooceanicola nanhaiensis]|uniref:response regulator n=2 Tax=Pseudooceanicola nanhaiensis TaxID=375761 RepID=UPI0035147A15